MLVTVVAPGGRAADLAVPADAPVAGLLGALAGAVLGPAAVGPWSLAGADGVPLPPGQSLAASGVGDGALLTLSAGPAGIQPTPASAATRPIRSRADGDLGPTRAGLDRAGSAPAGVTLAARPPLPWPLRERGAAALRALVAPGPVGGGTPDGRAAPDPGPEGWPGPGPEAASARGPGPAARVVRAWRATGYQRRLEAAVAAPVLTGCACVGVLSAAPGVGGTTVAALLAAALAGGHGATVAVDAHPGPGSLAQLLAPGPDVFAEDLLDVLEHPALTWPELRAALGRPGSRMAVLSALPEGGPARSGGPGSRMAVLSALPEGGPARSGGPGAAGRAGSLDERGWARLVRGLARHAAIVVVDCGPGLAGPAARAMTATADQLVLVTGPWARLPGSVQDVAGQLAGPGQPVAVVVSRAAAGLEAGQVLDRAPWARGVFLLPDDPARAAALRAEPFGWQEAPGRWRRQAYELAVLLASDWPALGLATLARQPATRWPATRWPATRWPATRWPATRWPASPPERALRRGRP